MGNWGWKVLQVRLQGVCVGEGEGEVEGRTSTRGEGRVKLGTSRPWQMRLALVSVLGLMQPVS